MQEEIEKLKRQSQLELTNLLKETDIYQFKSRYLGRNGSLTQLIKLLKNVPPGERAAVGALINAFKNELEEQIEQALSQVQAAARNLKVSEHTVDVTLPGRQLPLGGRHPVTMVADKIIDIFTRLGFEIVEGPEVELDFFNFEALNLPKDHPARDMHDTFYISDDSLLRTHTSPVQIRTMQVTSPPIRIICPGKVYRCDSDISHTPMFHQVEGLMVDENISFGDLKGLLTTFVQQIFDEDTRLRFRPSFFPFTEPSAEVDIQCVMCRGKGCRVCGNSGWLEILGSGMVHPQVFRNVGYDPEKVTGFAFGLGIERIAMLKFGINDIRLFFENDYRFLTQF
ncbi:MAG: phenylalanine--tRNA ligase subunit alpha [Proteobacteria bacterium]|nr:phenylalanine--tRNA ligase subunit alpha [Pseudomonadota bacterium]